VFLAFGVVTDKLLSEYVPTFLTLKDGISMGVNLTLYIFVL
jgi:hypothetical protein